MPAEGERARRIADALDIEAADLPLEAARREQHVLLGDEAVLEIELLPSFAVHELRGLAERQAGRPTFDQDRADPLDARGEAHIDEKDLGLPAVRREDFRSIEPVSGTF